MKITESFVFFGSVIVIFAPTTFTFHIVSLRVPIFGQSRWRHPANLSALGWPIITLMLSRLSSPPRSELVTVQRLPNNFALDGGGIGGDEEKPPDVDEELIGNASTNCEFSPKPFPHSLGQFPRNSFDKLQMVAGWLAGQSMDDSHRSPCFL